MKALDDRNVLSTIASYDVATHIAIIVAQNYAGSVRAHAFLYPLPAARDKQE